MERIKGINKKRLGEIIRFCMVGGVATFLQYAFYLLFLLWLNEGVSNTLAYGCSLMFNYIATTFFTFKSEVSAKRGLGFLTAHGINYTLQTICLLTFVHVVGIPKEWALLPTLCICVPINFMMIQFVFRK